MFNRTAEIYKGCATVKTRSANLSFLVAGSSAIGINEIVQST
jgi:hypothetical protein